MVTGCLDKTDCFGGGFCIYVEESIASKQLKLHLDKENEAIYLEINIRLSKCLIVGLHKPPTRNNSLFLEICRKIFQDIWIVMKT